MGPLTLPAGTPMWFRRTVCAVDAQGSRSQALTRSNEREGLDYMRLRSRIVSAAALVAAVLAGFVGPRYAPVAQAASVPAGLPTHFGLGVSAAPDNSGIYGWMPTSGIAWDYA